MPPIDAQAFASETRNSSNDLQRTVEGDHELDETRMQCHEADRGRTEGFVAKQYTQSKAGTGHDEHIFNSQALGMGSILSPHNAVTRRFQKTSDCLSNNAHDTRNEDAGGNGRPNASENQVGRWQSPDRTHQYAGHPCRTTERQSHISPPSLFDGHSEIPIADPSAKPMRQSEGAAHMVHQWEAYNQTVIDSFIQQDSRSPQSSDLAERRGLSESIPHNNKDLGDRQRFCTNAFDSSDQDFYDNIFVPQTEDGVSQATRSYLDEPGLRAQTIVPPLANTDQDFYDNIFVPQTEGAVFQATNSYFDEPGLRSQNIIPPRANSPGGTSETRHSTAITTPDSKSSIRPRSDQLTPPESGIQALLPWKQITWEGQSDLSTAATMGEKSSRSDVALIEAGHLGSVIRGQCSAHGSEDESLNGTKKFNSISYQPGGTSSQAESPTISLSICICPPVLY